MGARTGSLIGLFFGLLWLGLGVSVLAMPAKLIVAVLGIIAFGLIAFRVWRRAPVPGATFNRGIFLTAVGLEFAAFVIAGWVLDRIGVTGYEWPVVGAIVGLHFIGLWMASRDRRFLWLSGGMTAINLFAMTLAPASATMLMVSGFGSAVAIGLAVLA